MFDLLLRHARLVDDTLTNIALQDGKIAALGDVDGPALKTIDLRGECFVSAGWIDSHVHCYPTSPIYHDEPDSVGIATGVTTVVDAGSTGADDIGLKARMSSSVVGVNGITPLERAKAMQQENGNLPLMVHIGNNPPDLDEIAERLTAGDIITHCYNGKPNRILRPDGEQRASVTRALARGVRLDVGHA